jgi:hypothetical protein
MLMKSDQKTRNTGRREMTFRSSGIPTSDFRTPTANSQHAFARYALYESPSHSIEIPRCKISQSFVTMTLCLGTSCRRDCLGKMYAAIQYDQKLASRSTQASSLQPQPFSLHRSRYLCWSRLQLTLTWVNLTRSSTRPPYSSASLNQTEPRPYCVAGGTSNLEGTRHQRQSFTARSLCVISFLSSLGHLAYKCHSQKQNLLLKHNEALHVRLVSPFS